MPGASDEILERLKAQISTLETWTAHLKTCNKLHSTNTNPQRPGEADLNRLDASIKRNTALIKKLRTVTDDTCQSICADILKTNQSKYISEAVGALLDAPLRPRDVAAAVQVCSALHQRYADVAPQLGPGLLRMLALSRQGADEERLTQPRRRALLRLLGELILVGVLPAPSPLQRLVTDIAAALPWDRDREAAANNVALLAHFVKSLGHVYLPATTMAATLQPPASAPEDALAALHAAAAQFTAAAEGVSLPAALRDAVGAAVNAAFDSGCDALQAQHAALLDTEASNAKVLNNRGELPEELAAQYEQQRKSLDALTKSLTTIADVTGASLPVLQDAATRMTGSGGQAIVRQLDFASGDNSPFEDEWSRAFYETLPNLRTLLPGVLLQTTGAGEDAKVPAEPGTAGETQQQEVEATQGAEGGRQATQGAEGDSRVHDAAEQPQDGSTDQEEQGAGAGAAPAELQAVLSSLPTCTTPQQCDEACIAFCEASGAAKAPRRRLVRVLTDIPYTALDVIPYYARIAATLAPVFPDVPADVVKWLESEFVYVMASKDTTLRGMAPRTRCIRYMGELAKFRLMPYGSLFSHLKQLLDDFTGANVEMAAELMQVAGRFLYRLPETHTRADNMSSVMLKLKNAKNLDPRLAMLVDHAYLCVKPPAGGVGAQAKQRPPEQLYVEMLLLQRLDKRTTPKVLKKLRRLHWPECQSWVAKLLRRAAVKGRFSAQEHLASLTAALGRYHPGLPVLLADEVLERIRLGLEHPDRGTYQKRVAHMALLAQLYNYGVVDGRTVFDTLYLLLALGHEDARRVAALDPPSDCFRIRLACTLLLGCGRYFLKGRSRRRLDHYLLYLQSPSASLPAQRYVLSKAQPLPLDIEYLLSDMWTLVGTASTERLATYEAAVAAVAEHERAEAAAMASAPLDQGSDSDQERLAAALSSEDEDAPLGGSEPEEEEQAVGEEDEEGEVVLLEEAAPVEVDEEFEAALAAVVRDAQGNTVRASASAVPLSDASEAAQGTVAFRVVLRKGGKEDRSHEVNIPTSSGLAAAVQAGAAAEADERALMKRLVLEANAREEAEQAGASSRGRGKRVVLSYGGAGRGREANPPRL